MTKERMDTPDRTPPLSMFLAYGPVLIILATGVTSLQYPGIMVAGRIWASSILIFLAGVVRGLSFFTEGGARRSQIAAMGFRFGCGLLGLVLVAPIAFLVLATGYLSVLSYDPISSRSGGAPRYFETLRPPQMAVAVAGLLMMLWVSLT